MCVFSVDPSHFSRYQWEMKISRWCSSSTSSRWWYQSASLSRDQCLSTTVLSHPHSRIAQGMYVCRHYLHTIELTVVSKRDNFIHSDNHSRHSAVLWERFMIYVYEIYFLNLLATLCWYPLECGCITVDHVFILFVLQPVGRLPAAPQLRAVSNHTVAVPLQPSTVAAAIFRYDLVSRGCKVVIEKTFCDNIFGIDFNKFLCVILPNKMSGVFCSSVKSNMQFSFTKPN